jgi:hypothetical protein
MFSRFSSQERGRASAILQEKKLDMALVPLVYASVCKLAVDASLHRLGVEQLNIGDVHCLEWEACVVFVLRVLTVYIMAPLTINQPNKKTRTTPFLLSNVEPSHSILKKIKIKSLHSRDSPTKHYLR